MGKKSFKDPESLLELPLNTSSHLSFFKGPERSRQHANRYFMSLKIKNLVFPRNWEDSKNTSIELDAASFSTTGQDITIFDDRVSSGTMESSIIDPSSPILKVDTKKHYFTGWSSFRRHDSSHVESLTIPVSLNDVPSEPEHPFIVTSPPHLEISYDSEVQGGITIPDESLVCYQKFKSENANLIKPDLSIIDSLKIANERSREGKKPPIVSLFHNRYSLVDSFSNRTVYISGNETGSFTKDRGIESENNVQALKLIHEDTSVGPNNNYEVNEPWEDIDSNTGSMFQADTTEPDTEYVLNEPGSQDLERNDLIELTPLERSPEFDHSILWEDEAFELTKNEKPIRDNMFNRIKMVLRRCACSSSPANMIQAQISQTTPFSPVSYTIPAFRGNRDDVSTFLERFTFDGPWGGSAEDGVWDLFRDEITDIPSDERLDIRDSSIFDGVTISESMNRGLYSRIKFDKYAEVLVYDRNDKTTSSDNFTPGEYKNNCTGQSSQKENKSRKLSYSGSIKRSKKRIGSIISKLSDLHDSPPIPRGNNEVLHAKVIKPILKNRENQNMVHESVKMKGYDDMSFEDFLYRFESHERSKMESEPYLISQRKKQINTYNMIT